MNVIKKYKTYAFLALVAVSCTVAVLIYYFFFFHPHSQYSASTFAWSSDGRIIYYISLQNNNNQLRYFNRQALFSRGDNEIKLQEALAPTAITTSSGNNALVTGVVSYSKNTWANLLDTKKNQLSSINLKWSPRLYAFSSEGTQIAYTTDVSSRRSNINLFSTKTMSVTQELLLQKSVPTITGLWWTENDGQLYIASQPNPNEFFQDLYIFDLQTKELTLLLSSKDEYLYFAPHGDKILCASPNGIGVYNRQTNNQAIVFDELKDAYTGVCSLADANTIVCQMANFTANKRTFTKINLQSLKKTVLTEIPIKRQELVRLTFSPSPKGDRLAYLDEQNIIRLIPIK